MSNNSKPSPLAPRHTNRLTDTHLKKMNIFSIRTVGEKHKVLQQRIGVRCFQASGEENKRQQQDENLSQISLLMRLSAKTNTSTTTDNAELGTCINKVNAVTWVSAALLVWWVGIIMDGWWQSRIFCSHFEHWRKNWGAWTKTYKVFWRYVLSIVCLIPSDPS